MTSRFRLAWVVGLSLAPFGCGSFNAGSIEYKPSPRAEAELKDKPQLRAAIDKALADLFGPSPREIKGPRRLGPARGGRRLGN